jgi:putative protein-disulfide isomerase
VQLVYVFDCLSLWCYAFRPEILTISSAVAGKLPLRLACSSPVAEAERPLGGVREALGCALSDVTRRSGVGFGKAFVQGALKAGAWVLRAEPVARAVLVAQQMQPERALDFAHALSAALYWRGQQPDAPETLAEVARATLLDAAEFLSRWGHPGAMALTEAAHLEARQRGFRTAPSLFLVDGEVVQPVCEGYVRATEALQRLDALLCSQARSA